MAVRNQLPEGVGRKIVEALKRQAEANISPITDIDNTNLNSDSFSDVKTFEDVSLELSQEKAPVEDFIVEESPIVDTNENVNVNINNVNASNGPLNDDSKIEVKENIEEIPIAPKQVQPFDFSEQTIVKKDKLQKPTPVVSVNIPSNVAILRNLIATLPAGVSKQTGAQIIRQTLEAMGLPMNSVLKEAQEVQEELNTSVREFMLKIQEYKTNILRLEESVNEYQKNVAQLNDLVSLFLLTDKNN